MAASTAAAAILLAGVYVLNSHRTGLESAQAPPGDAASVQQWWAAGAPEHVAELHKAFDGVEQRAKELDEAGARNECERMHDAAAVDLQAHLPSPAPELTSELNAAIVDTHTQRICVCPRLPARPTAMWPNSSHISIRPTDISGPPSTSSTINDRTLSAHDEEALMNDKPVEVISWNADDHTDLPGFAHGLTRYGGHWMDVGISVVPVDVDPLEALDKVFARLRETIEQEVPDPDYFTVEIRVASKSRLRPPDAAVTEEPVPQKVR
ncbi:hypothetical protein CQY20_23840 [Mycolicibacterium agri]|nr:hypothetical protein [Mycolicibacterium agri]PEG34827.1 hypothetical protein CQY20_23840 [Mycolicibacterium agri]